MHMFYILFHHSIFSYNITTIISYYEDFPGARGRGGGVFTGDDYTGGGQFSGGQFT